MKVEWRTCLGASLFLGATGALYWALVGSGHGDKTEAAGIACLIFSFAAYALLAGYLYVQYLKRRRIPRVEDRFDAEQADGEGVIDHFPSASIWPAAMGLGMIFGAMALVWGVWYLVIGFIIFVGAVIGYTVESEAPAD
jgi:Cytochrome c oxidase subunit IV